MLLSLALLACSKDAPPAEPHEDPAPTFTVRVDPPSASIVTGPDGASPIQFTATAVYEDGTEQLLDLVEWSLSNRSAGTLDDAGLFVPSSTNGGVTWVSARLAGVEGQSTVSVVYQEDQNVTGVDETLFDGTPTPIDPAATHWGYPEDGVNLPRNTPSIDFQWNADGIDASKLTFKSELTELSVYTTGGTWVADSDTWERISSTNAGGQVEVTLALSSAGVLYEEPTRVLNVNRLDATGAVIYWSTSIQGFLRIPFGEPAAPYLTAADTGHTCQGCHAISSTGELAYTYDGNNGALSIKNLDKSVVNDNAGVGNMKTFSPDGKYLLATQGGNLRLVDAADGADLGFVRQLGDCTQPDWSPDGWKVAVAVGAGIEDDLFMKAPTNLGIIDVGADGSFSDVTVLVNVQDPWRAYYPAWSPDGQWLAYNLSTGDSYNDPDAELWVVDREGKRPPVRLDAANSVGQLTDSWPRWGPLPDDDVLWLAFASTRNYGFVTQALPQIWVAGFDPAKAEAGQDPSWPAFWLPGQDTVTANHLPLWVP